MNTEEKIEKLEARIERAKVAMRLALSVIHAGARSLGSSLSDEKWNAMSREAIDKLIEQLEED